MLKEFKEFATRGNVFDMAIGIIIGASFQSIVTSLVNDIITPFISLFTGNVDFSDLGFNINGVAIKYGSFITAIIDFLFISFTIFLLIKYFNKINKKMSDLTSKEKEKLNKKFNKKAKNEIPDPTPEPTVKICPYCLSEINYKATRCSHCTSKLDKPGEISVLDKQIEIEVE